MLQYSYYYIPNQCSQYRCWYLDVLALIWCLSSKMLFCNKHFSYMYVWHEKNMTMAINMYVPKSWIKSLEQWFQLVVCYECSMYVLLNKTSKTQTAPWSAWFHVIILISNKTIAIVSFVQKTTMSMPNL